MNTTAPTYFVYGFTDRWCCNGFPACDGPIESLDEAKKQLANLGNRGFHYPNRRGWRGWITEFDSGKTVFPPMEELRG